MMIDLFVLVAPIYLLAVIALAGFVGCQVLFPVDEYHDDPEKPEEPPGPPQPPSNIQGIAGDGVVTLLWDPVPDALLFEIDRKIAPPGMPPPSYDFLIGLTPAQLPIINGFMTYEDHAVTNGITYHYVVRVTTGAGTSVNSGDIEVTPKSNFGPFVTDFVAGTVRAGEDGWFGFAFVADVPGLTVEKLGRFYLPSNSGSHDIDIIDGATLQILGKATVDTSSEDLDGFKYAIVTPSPVTLNVNDEYFILSLETLGGDDFLTQDTTVTTNAEASVTNAIESTTLVTFTTAGGSDHVYGPLNFQY
jgi:hypothetical protein